jgi:hypothetical protein
VGGGARGTPKDTAKYSNGRRRAVAIVGRSQPGRAPLKKWISAIVAGLVGGALAVFAAWGVVTSSTAAPDHNPAGTQVVDYGQK